MEEPAVMEGSEVVHEDGRKCEYTGSGWLRDADNPDEDRVECDREHPGDDRGAGMPTLGKGARDLLDGNQTWKARMGRVHEVTLRPTLVINSDGITVDYGEQGYTVPAVTEDARYTLTILPDILTQFLEKNAKYRSVQEGYDLGDQGIIPDLNRKLGILVDRIWHGNQSLGESTDEVIGDLIGHLLLMLAKRRDQ
jgi:hypothetical protein